ncbi:unnamed protein product, partial [Owenia fusiformis]
WTVKTRTALNLGNTQDLTTLTSEQGKRLKGVIHQKLKMSRLIWLLMLQVLLVCYLTVPTYSLSNRYSRASKCRCTEDTHKKCCKDGMTNTKFCADNSKDSCFLAIYGVWLVEDLYDKCQDSPCDQTNEVCCQDKINNKYYCANKLIAGDSNANCLYQKFSSV